MDLLVVNNSTIKDQEIENWINELFEKYKKICDCVPPYQIIFCQGDLKEKINRINKGDNNLVALIQNYVSEFLYQETNNELIKYIERSNSHNLKIIVLMECANISHPWGEANNFIEVIKHISKFNLWHEFSHFFGADDHYGSNQKVKDICRNEKCIMVYGNEYEVFCEKSQEEIWEYFKLNMG